MTMNDLLPLALAWMAGIVLGTFFFGGLWWTVRKGIASLMPAFWFFGSLIIRMGGALAGFYFVAAGQWERLLLCLLGFVIARLIVMRLTRSPGENQTGPAEAASYAP
jgi:F1F0 ATPase subunit 2